MKRLLLALALTMSLPVVADIQSGTPQFNWTQPTQWIDGQPLTTSQITGYQLECNGATTISRRIAAATGVPPLQISPANRFAPGVYTCTLAVYARQTTGSPEVMSVPSNSVSFTVPQPAPNAPTGFSVN